MGGEDLMQVADTVRPGSLEREPDAPVAGEPHAVLGHRRSEEVAAEFLKAGSVGGQHPHIPVEVEPVEMRLARACGGD